MIDYTKFELSLKRLGEQYEKAARCLEVIPGFIQGAVDLYQTMTGRRWE